MKFRSWLEKYEIDPGENEKVTNLNMTRGLWKRAVDVSKQPGDFMQKVQNSISGLTRGFHLNTIISRLLQPWTTNRAPVRHDLAQNGEGDLTREDLEKVYQWCQGKDRLIAALYDRNAPKDVNNDYKPNAKFGAAYELFKQEIANAIDQLPYKEGLNVHADNYEDVLAPVKQFFAGVKPEGKGLIESMNSAFEIYRRVFGLSTGVRDFLNFYQIVYDEFMKLSERLPTMGDDDESLNFKDSSMAKSIKQEIDKYNKLMERARG